MNNLSKRLKEISNYIPDNIKMVDTIIYSYEDYLSGNKKTPFTEKNIYLGGLYNVSKGKNHCSQKSISRGKKRHRGRACQRGGYSYPHAVRFDYCNVTPYLDVYEVSR